ncbi:MAG: M3 family oligoendopeptidase [Clostridia bacterium]|nr:M3 family oligoendopeptidase [Clostridia bacterium]
MIVSQIPYKRYTIEELTAHFNTFEKAMKEAKCASDVIEARKAFLAASAEANTAGSLAYCRFTLNTKDEFYSAEMDYYNQTGPLASDLSTKYAALMLESPFRTELETMLNPRLFRQWEMARKTFDPCIIEDCQEENAVVTEYSKRMSEMVFTYEGEEMPLSVLRGKLEDADREVRRKAAFAIGEGLEKNAEALDSLYDRLVKIRTRIAGKLGYKTFTELGYYRMGRLDYDAAMVAAFRENVRKSLVPVIASVKEEIKEELGLDEMMFYDNDIYGSGASLTPILDKDGMFAEAQAMYNRINPEIGAFMAEMQAAEAFDVEARDGKWGGGYCTVFETYEQPFILANFNGTTGDVDVLTHEFGHAFAMKKVFDRPDRELGIGGSETAECHSMSMEFLSWPGMDAFFGKDAGRYRRKHLLDALSFIPYGVAVDEFQHIVYENPDMTPAQRKAAWLDLEKKYRPYMSYGDIPYLNLGTRWQFQMHIYEMPFYYIDYCLAQTVAMGFLCASREDYEGALRRYVDFCKTGGEKAFGQLIADAGLADPFTDGALDTMAEKVMAVLEEIK